MDKLELYIYCTIATPNVSDIVKTRDFINKNYDKSLPLSVLYGMNIGFYLRDSDDMISNDYTYLLKDNIVSGTSIDLLMFEVLYRDNNFDDTDVPKLILSTLCGFDLIIKVVDNNFYFIANSEINKVGEDIMNIMVDDDKYMYFNKPDYDSAELFQFRESYDSFIALIESSIMNDACYVSITSSNGMEWAFDILRDGSDKYPSKEYPEDSSVSKSGYRYMCGYDNLMNFLYSNISVGENLLMTMITFANLVDNNLVHLDMDDRIYKKIYCTVLTPVDDKYFTMYKLSASEVFAICRDNIPSVHPNYNFIYCGCEETDIICGFDMVD